MSDQVSAVCAPVLWSIQPEERGEDEFVIF